MNDHKIPEKPSLKEILQAQSSPAATVLGESRGGRDILGYHFGSGTMLVSLIGGCHADEPTGPIFLQHLVQFLGSLSEQSPWLQKLSWWLVPHVNPDGEEINSRWYAATDTEFDFATNLKHAYRELPGDDIEFGFPLGDSIPALRPENQAVYDFWRSAGSKFNLHVSLHGMHISYGPWFLIDRDFTQEVGRIMGDCSEATSSMGYVLHDVDRRGEKGFFRLAHGFGSRPDSGAMREYFLNQGQPQMASKFHASSMESIRSLGDPCLTLVTEMPLFIVPRTHWDLQWPDPTLVHWSQRIDAWKTSLLNGSKSTDEVNAEAAEAGLRAMPVVDQMALQWTFIWSGILQRFSTPE